MSKTTYRFDNVKVSGKTLAFNAHAFTYTDALKNAVNYIIKHLKLDELEFPKQLNYLKQNIQDGYTNVSVQKKPEQGELKLELKFNDTFEELYSGLINERG